MCNHKRAFKNIKYLRVSESGDFRSQDDVEKLSVIAHMLKLKFNITTYTYTAREDLDFSNVGFLVKGSSNDAGNNGKTIVRYKKDMTNDYFYNENNKYYHICPAYSCSSCTVCKIQNGIDIVFIKH